MNSSMESEAIESDADCICRNDKTLTEVGIFFSESDAVDIFDALKNNTVVNWVEFYTQLTCYW